MTIVVTGAGGFVGAALVRKLLHAGRHVVAVDRTAEALVAHPNLETLLGDIGDGAVRARAVAYRPDSVVHLATVPGGAAEVDPLEAKRINVDASMDLLEDLAQYGGEVPRFVFASSIAVFGDPFPQDGVNDLTPLAPKLIYGGHKAMMEIAVAMHHRRGTVDGVTVRLSGIVARPAGAAGLKSAFMSDVFHALREGRRFVSPVGPHAALWLQSVERCVDNLVHALETDGTHMPPERAVTLPAVRVTMKDLVAELTSHLGAEPGLVSYSPDDALERAFGRHPNLDASAAESAGFRGDGDTASLVAATIASMAPGR